MEPSYLAKVLNDLGPSSCDHNVFSDVIQQLAPVIGKDGMESQIALSLSMMCASTNNITIKSTANNNTSNTEKGSKLEFWNTSVFGLAVLESFPKIDVNKTFSSLDNAQLLIKSPSAAEMLVVFFKVLCGKKFYQVIDLSILFKPWKNLKGQLDLILNLLLCKPDVFNFSLFQSPKVLSKDEISSLSPTSRNLAVQLASHTWNCYSLFEFISKIIDTDNFEDSKPIFELASRQCPELLCIALSSMDPSWNSINKEILVKLSCGFLLGQSGSSVVLPRIWNLNPNILLFCMVEMHRRDNSCLSRLLDVSQEFKILPVILDAKPFSFTLDLACLASRRQNLNLEKWLSDSLREKGDVFLRVAVEFLVEKTSLYISLQRQPSTTGHGQPVTLEIIQTLCKVLSTNFQSMPPDLISQFRDVLRVLSPQESQSQQLGTIFSGNNASFNKSGTGSNSDSGSLMPIAENFPPDVEEEVNGFFDKIFAREIRIPDILEVLKRLKMSGNIRDQLIFACFIQNIFEEFKFFSKYPDDELNITAILFGSLINCQLISFNPLGIALKCILEALKKPPNTKLFKFGLQSLLQFSERLPEWPQFCTHLVQINQIQHAHTELYSFIHSCVSGNPSRPPPIPNINVPAVINSNSPQSESLPSAPSQAKITTQSGVTGSSEGINMLMDPSVSGEVSNPPDIVKDKILFIINNLAPTNLSLKAVDLKKILEKSYFPWLAQYFVIRRACIEPNYHGLYIEFLQKLEIEDLNKQILSLTYKSITALIESDNVMASSSERSLLKNLGMWLGGITLARNQPILFKDLSLKDLIVEAFNGDRLIIVVPFICKVLEQCAKSRAFQPDNPWLISILRVLLELYHYANLRLNLKFEIEVLCKNLEISLQSLEPSNILKQRPTSMLLYPGQQSDLAIAEANESSGHSSGSTQSGEWNFWLARSSLYESPILPLISFATYRIGSAKYSMLLKYLLAASVEYAIRDLAMAVSQRCFLVATNTTRALVGKDFFPSLVPETVSIFIAVRSMAPALSANLAFVTSRESLKTMAINNLRAFCDWADISHLISEASLESLSEENMELACAYVEKLAYEKTLSNVDSIVPKDFDAEKYAFRPANVDSKITTSQAQVYNEFTAKFRPAHLANLPSIQIDPVSQEELESLSTSLSKINLLASGGVSEMEPTLNKNTFETGNVSFDFPKSFDSALSPGVLASEGSSLLGRGSDISGGMDAYFEVVCVKFVEMVTAIENHIFVADSDLDLKGISNVSSLPHSHEIRSLMKQIILLASSSPIHKDELCLLMSQRLVQGLYKTRSDLYVDVIILLLIKIFEFSSKAAKEVTTWVIHSTDERKYSVIATVALFSSGLVYVLDYDSQLARQLEGANSVKVPMAIDFAIELIRKCIFADPPVAAPYDFVYSLEALGKLCNEDCRIKKLLEDIAVMVKAPQPEHQLLRDRVTFCFTDWFRLCQYPSISDKLISSFVEQLFQRRFLVDEDSSRSFFQLCTEICIELYVRQRRAPAILAYRSVDAFARLLGQIIRFHPNNTNSTSFSTEEIPIIDPLRIVSIVHSVSGMILIQGLDQGIEYLQRPFTRLFVCLAGEILKNCGSKLAQQSAVIENLRSFYLILSPKNDATFAFGWLELIVNKCFLPYLLLPTENVTGVIVGSSVEKELISQRHGILFEMLFEFLEFVYPVLEKHDSNEISRVIYRGLLRVFLIILHDCPDFFFTYGKRILDVMPHSVIQLRNAVLAAVPLHVSLLPDPMQITPLPTDLQNQPDFPMSCIEENLQETASSIAPSLKNVLDNAKFSSPTQDKNIRNVISQMLKMIQFNENEGSVDEYYPYSSYGKHQVQNIISYLGYFEMANLIPNRVNIKEALREPKSSLTLEVIRAAFTYDDQTIESTKCYGINHLRYLMIGAIADKLTYPCVITYFFHHMILVMFQEFSENWDDEKFATLSSNSVHEKTAGEKIKEVISRVLLERLIVHRPHPWGIMVTFIELVKNPIYKLWEYDFTRATPDIERVFQAILHNCLGTDLEILSSNDSTIPGKFPATTTVPSKIK